MAVAYLDVDDEITTAVARLRASPDYRVALVLPAGSHVATSRINFRLLAREAQNHQRRLAIVSPDSAVRAIVVAAGLPAYASVQAYEEALAEQLAAAGADAAHYADEAAREETGRGGPGVAPGRGGQEGGSPGSSGASERAAGGGSSPVRTRGEGAAGEGAAGAGTTGATRGEEAAGEGGGEDGGEGGPGATPGAGGAGAGGAAAGTLGADGAGADLAGRRAPPEDRSGEARAAGPVSRSAGALPVVKGDVRAPGRRGPSRRLVAGLVVVLLLVVAAGAGAYFVLPAATITVTPQAQAVGPISLEVTADPAAGGPDPATGVVPATSVSVKLSAQASFNATGVKVTETSAKGSVVFSSNNPLDTVTVPSGTTLSTASGVQFQTTAGVVIPKATISGNTITAGRATVSVEAVAAGTDGNVPAHAIDRVPQALASLLVSADNPDPTTGGTRTETPVVNKHDYDGALKSLTSQLDDQLKTALATPSTAPSGVTLIPATASLGTVSADQPASAVVGKAEKSFDLAVSATATVLGIDEQQVSNLGRTRLESAVTPGDQLFADSVKVTLGTPAVSDGKVSVPVQASGQEWHPVSAAELLPEVKGRSVSEARAILARYGTVKIETWPGWVDRVPSLDARVELVVASPQRGTP